MTRSGLRVPSAPLIKAGFEVNRFKAAISEHPVILTGSGKLDLAGSKTSVTVEIVDGVGSLARTLNSDNIRWTLVDPSAAIMFLLANRK